MKNLTYIILYI